MARKLGVQYPGAVYHLMNRGDRREPIYQDDQDRQRFLETLAECCVKTGWQVHAYGLMTNHFHLVVETPQPNLVDGTKWFLVTDTARFNRRHKLFGHLFNVLTTKSVTLCGEEFFACARRERRAYPQWFCEERATLRRRNRTAARRVAPKWSGSFVAPRSQPTAGMLPRPSSEGTLRERPKGDATKVKLAQRLRAETVRTEWLAQRLHLGSRAYAHHLLWRARKIQTDNHKN